MLRLATDCNLYIECWMYMYLCISIYSSFYNLLIIIAGNESLGWWGEFAPFRHAAFHTPRWGGWVGMDNAKMHNNVNCALQEERH